MSSQHRSISQRLNRAKSAEAKRDVVSDWARRWHSEQLSLVQQLEKSIKNDDYDQLCIVTGQLKAVTNKRFIGLSKMVDKLM